ncbi:ABC transporter permease [Clostridium cellulovorans]|uniref:Transport permease protein n=1 Tax=Clostridium cellulovorans (strain ATCC 35296 / DSM 3052 / OCM 3 / 743B) TaxID=573061 RepID=D9SWM4_CLOC7|nr:ABC transporter permease [Clostridium cellulovorans]ADL53306.1 ABC-2 type transporter [Clostridium cellulovorans 743B]
MLFEQLKVELRTYLRQPLYLVFSILMPVMSFIMFGVMYGNQSYDGVDFFSQYIPGLCVIVLFSSSVFNIGNQVISDKEKGIYKRLAATPVKLSRIMFVVILKAFFVAIIGFILILILAKTVFDATFSTIGLFIPVYIAMVIYSLILGFGIGAIIDKATTYSIAMMSLFFPMFILSDASFPLAMMPEVLKKAANFNPLYHINIVLRIAWDSSLYSQFKNEFWLAVAFLSVLMGIFLMVVAYVWKRKRK